MSKTHLNVWSHLIKKDGSVMQGVLFTKMAANPACGSSTTAKMILIYLC
jgi:hypothetical protein